MDLFNQKDESFLSVSEITGLIKRKLEESFSQVKVIGEISNFKAHVSGHWYFTLKDSNAQISCTMWKGMNNHVFFTPQDGMKIIVNGRITVYPPRGNYQLDVRSMKTAGEGELQAAFERLKRKLADEGLFDEALKKPIPQFPKRIGIITAIGGAAFKDMISVAERRFPIVELLIASSKVQGEGAADEIANNIKLLNNRDDIDLIIIGRGGGSLEDLWAFNEEVVAREIFESKIPIISGVGHEIDFTIADFAADLRAPTPTAAMELATPSRDEIIAFINDFSYTSTNNIFSIIDRYSSQVNQVLSSYGFRIHDEYLRNRSQYLDNIWYKIQMGIENSLTQLQNKLALTHNSIEAFNLDKILKKGFAIVKQNEEYVTRGKDFKQKEKTKIKFYDKQITIN